MKRIYTPEELGKMEHPIGSGKPFRGPQWWRAAIRLRRVKAEKLGGVYAVDEDERDRVYENPPIITAQEMVNLGKKKKKR